MNTINSASKLANRQYSCLQPIERKPPTVALSIPTVKEILDRWDRTDQFPAEIAKNLGLNRSHVDVVLKRWRRKIA